MVTGAVMMIARAAVIGALSNEAP
jgi:hypothetical protein